MANPTQRQALIDTMVTLAEEIARASPESADKAVRLVELLHELGTTPDRSSVHDAIEAQTAGTELSDAQVRNTTEAVVRAMRDEAR